LKRNDAHPLDGTQQGRGFREVASIRPDYNKSPQTIDATPAFAGVRRLIAACKTVIDARFDARFSLGYAARAGEVRERRNCAR